MVRFSVLLLWLISSPLLGGQVEDWARRVETGSPNARRSAALSLGNTGPSASQAIPALLKAVQIVDPWNRETREARREVFIALGKIGPNDLRVFQLLVDELADDPQRLDRQYGVDETLVKMGPAGVGFLENILSGLPLGTNADNYRIVVLLRYLATQGRSLDCYLPFVKRFIEIADTGEGEILLLLQNGGAEAAKRELLPTVRKKLERLIETRPSRSRGIVRLLESKSVWQEEQILGTSKLLYHFAPDDKTALPLLERARKWYLKGGEGFVGYETEIADLIHRLTYGTPMERDEPSLRAYHFLQQMLNMVRTQPASYESGLARSIPETIRKQLELALPADREVFLAKLHSVAPNFFGLLMREIYESSTIQFVDKLRGIESCSKILLEFDREKQ